MKPAYEDESPIAAYATIPGESALSVIRTSGPASIDLVSRAFSRPKKLKESPGNTLLHGLILDNNGQPIDEVIVSVFRGPRSYTGEDSIEISCHGGHAPARAILERLFALGFRQALPGEFTFRAFVNSKLDLTRAESVMELVSAKTDVSREHALSRLSGNLKQEIESIKTLLVEILAGVELFLDYSEDDGVALNDEEVAEAEGIMPGRQKAAEAMERLESLSSSYKTEKLYQEGALAVIAGQPNAGKSSLFNLFLREDRSIVTDIPGTTRDWIESQIALEGIPIRLADTAGLHCSTDPVEQLGITQSQKLIDEADMVLYLIDGNKGITKDDLSFFSDKERFAPDSGKTLILLWNKIDQNPLSPLLHIPPLNTSDKPSVTNEKRIMGISAKTGEGFMELQRVMVSSLMEKKIIDEAGLSLPNQGSSLGTLRQKTLIDTALLAVKETLKLADKKEPLDLIAPLLREAVNSLGEITGEVSTLDILDTLFSRFCIGK